MINATNPSHLASTPRVDVMDTRRGGKKSEAQKMLWSVVEGGMARERTRGEIKHELGRAQDLLNVSKSGLQVEVVRSDAEQMHYKYRREVGRLEFLHPFAQRTSQGPDLSITSPWVPGLQQLHG